MRVGAQANNIMERRLQVPMLKAITLPLTVNGVHSDFVLYVTVNGWASNPPSDQDLIKVSRHVADAINQGNPA